MHWMPRAALAACLALALGACAGQAQESEVTRSDAYGPLRAQRTEMAQAFAAQAAYCSAREDADHFAFHGCVDWHSAAHAAWALTAYEAWTGDTQYRAQIDVDLTAEKIAQEVEYLRARPGFEMPYGRAWFLRLAVERQHLRADGRLDPLAEISAQSLRAYYEATPPNPNRDRYNNPSWALINLLHYARATQNAELEAWIVGQARAHFLTPPCELSRESVGFIAICTTWAWLMSETLPAAEFRAWYADWNPGLETLTPVTTYPSAHDYGRNFSRAWGLHHLAEALDDDRLRASYVAHVQAGFAPDSRWKGDYMANGHWVAQFGMLAIAPMFEDGDPSHNPG